MQQSPLGQLHINLISVKNEFFAHESVYCVNSNKRIINAIKTAQHVLNFRPNKQNNKLMPHDIPGVLLETVGADISIINYEIHLCIVDYHRKFPVASRQMGSGPVA